MFLQKLDPLFAWNPCCEQKFRKYNKYFCLNYRVAKKLLSTLVTNCHQNVYYLQMFNCTLALLIPWLMEPGGSMQHSQRFSNNPYPEPNQANSSYRYLCLRSILILSSHLRLGLPEGLFPVGVTVKILKESQGD